jgi:hypothetical protein
MTHVDVLEEMLYKAIENNRSKKNQKFSEFIVSNIDILVDSIIVGFLNL